MEADAISRFAQSLRGPLIGRDHPEYDEARKLYNAMIDKRPLLIARCVDIADVIASVNFGRDNKLPIAVRGGGHNGPGLASVDDGLVIDLSPTGTSTVVGLPHGTDIAGSPARFAGIV